MNIALIILTALRFLFIGDSITDGGWGVAAVAKRHLSNAITPTKTTSMGTVT